MTEMGFHTARERSEWYDGWLPDCVILVRSAKPHTFRKRVLTLQSVALATGIWKSVELTAHARFRSVLMYRVRAFVCGILSVS